MNESCIKEEPVEERTVYRRKRVSAPKNKTGCRTCKVRHIKCDETWPECNKCKSTGRRCDGLPNSAATASTTSALPLSIKAYAIPFSIPGSQNERRLFHYFCVQAASDFCGYSGSKFWTELVLPCSNTEPAVRHALMALGSMHCDYVVKGSFTDAQDTINPDALAQYNKALRQLRKCLNKNERSSTKVVLICCILFYCFESACGRYETALTHIKSGLVILQQKAAQGVLTPSSNNSGIDEDMQTLLDVFARTDLQGCFYENGHLPYLVLTTGDERLGLASLVPERMTTIDMARRSIDQLQNWAFHFLAQNQTYKFWHPDQVPYEVLQEKFALEGALMKWFSSFRSLMEQVLDDASTPRGDKDAILVLAVHHRVVAILLQGTICQDGIIFPNFDIDFAEIVAMSERVLFELDSNEPRRSFSFETALVPALWLVAMKCYSPELRERVLFLLESAPRREGLWDSTMVLGILEQIVAREAARGFVPGDLSQALTLESSYSAEIFSTVPTGGLHNYAKLLGVERTSASSSRRGSNE